MKFITDANIPRTIVERLKQNGIDIVSIREYLPPNASDNEV